MKKLLVASVLFGGLLSAGEMTGWISDSTCGAGNASNEKASRDCALNCIKGGAKAVFVSEKDQKVYQLSDQSKAAKFTDKKVKVDGKINGNTLELTSISYAE